MTAKRRPDDAATSTGKTERVGYVYNRKHYSTRIMRRKDIHLMSWGMFALGALFGVMLTIIVTLLTSPAYAEDELTYECWVLCQPEDYVNIRATASRHGEVCGYATSGMRFETDWVEKNGFLHLVGVTEYGEGWVSEGYVVFTEPKAVDRQMTITGKGRVAARKTIEGQRRKWLKPGETVTVYMMDSEWAVTSAGLVQSRFLGE